MVREGKWFEGTTDAAVRREGGGKRPVGMESWDWGCGDIRWVQIEGDVGRMAVGISHGTLRFSGLSLQWEIRGPANLVPAVQCDQCPGPSECSSTP